jgi:hypothetical protein
MQCEHNAMVTFRFWNSICMFLRRFLFVSKLSVDSVRMYVTHQFVFYSGLYHYVRLCGLRYLRTRCIVLLLLVNI